MTWYVSGIFRWRFYRQLNVYVRNFEGREWEEHEDKLRGKSKCKGGTEKSSAKNANDEDKNCIE